MVLRSFGEERYLTNQHERDSETGFDYRGARFYDAEVGRFLSVDPLANVPHSISLNPYHFVANNPINYIDPDGRDWYKNSDGAVVYDENITSQQHLEDAGISGSYLHADKLDKSVIDAIGAHIMNSGDNALDVFVGYFEDENLGENYFLDAANQNYSTNATGFMGSLTDLFQSTEDGILISQMTHDWVDEAGWTESRNEAEHGIGMFLMSEAHNSGIANIIGLGNEIRGLLINDRQSGNMWNAILGRSTNNGGPTAFEWKDLGSNNKGLQFHYKYKNPNPSVNFDLSGFQ